MMPDDVPSVAVTTDDAPDLSDWHPTVMQRARASMGLAGVVIAAGIAIAVTVAIAVVAMAVLIATAFD